MPAGQRRARGERGLHLRVHPSLRWDGGSLPEVQFERIPSVWFPLQVSDSTPPCLPFRPPFAPSFAVVALLTDGTSRVFSQFATEEPEAEPDATQIVAIEQETEQLRAALAKLRPEQREVIEKAYLGELTHQEISTQTGLPLGTIKSRIRLGLQRLRHELKDLSE